MIRRPPRSTQSRSSAASDVYKRQATSLDGHGDVLEAAQARLGRVEHLGGPATPFGIAQVHPEQVAREEGGLLAALTGLDLHDHVPGVVRVSRHELSLIH